MMKKALKVIAGVALAGCMLLPLAACSDTNNSEEVKQLQQQIQDLQTEIDSLKNDNIALTGCPKLEYALNETIPYYVNGTKIFDFKVTSFECRDYDNFMFVYYTVTFIPSFNANPQNVFSAVMHNIEENTLVDVDGVTNKFIRFSNSSKKQKTIILYYLNQPFACITATPTQM